jgi:hypothetical protein
MNSPCSQCANIAAVWNGPADLRLCVCHPDHAGQLVLVASGTAGSDDAAPRCRSFRRRREPDVTASPAASDTMRYIRLAGASFAIVDAADYDWLNRHRWRALGGQSGYAYSTIGGKNVLMHRLIMNAPPGKVVDHINGNRQDNRRCNLRVCTQAENMRNTRKSCGTSRFKGVSWNRKYRKWVVSIHRDGKDIWLGNFDDEIKAAQAYDKAARELFGPFARLNFPDFGNIVRLSGRITARCHVRGRIVTGVRQNMRALPAGMAPSAASCSLSSRPEAEGRSGEIWSRMEATAHALPDASTLLHSARHDKRSKGRINREWTWRVRRPESVGSRGPPLRRGT